MIIYVYIYIPQGGTQGQSVAAALNALFFFLIFLKGIRLASKVRVYIYTALWFQTFFIFHNIWDNPSL
jgi:hypothetical protein